MSEPDYYRLLDANLNRVCEGLRVLEDWFRFARPDPDFVSYSKSLRHRIRRQPAAIWPQLPSLQLGARDSLRDCGPEVTSQLQELGQTQQAYSHSNNLITANCKRIQEGLRSLEEISRLIGQTGLSDLFEQCRYQSYELERRCFLSKKAEADRDSNPDWSGHFRGLYGITMADPVRGRDHVDAGRALLLAGVRILQYRNKTDDMKKQYEDCLLLAEACRCEGALFIVNDRLDLALAASADGIHLGQEDLPPASAGRIIQNVRQRTGWQTDGRPFLIGLSTHNPGQAEAACSEAVDYIGVGPIYPTNTKTDLKCPVAGLDYLHWASGKISLPQVAIGGITMENLADVLDNGARCCALISSVILQDDITSAARRVHARIIEKTKEIEERNYDDDEK